MKKNLKTTTDAFKIMEQIAGTSAEMKKLVEQERANLDIAGKIQQLRTQAGLSQKQLAAKLGTTQSVISRLEDADYDGHSLAMLNRVATALQKRVEIHFVPARRRRLQHA